MKYDISKDGHLTLIPESEMESFALKKWWEHYSIHTKPDDECKYTIGILSHKQNQSVIETDKRI